MKKILAVVLLLIAANCHASQKAITDTGETITLNSNGTWEYTNKKPTQTQEIVRNNNKFEKPDNSTFLLKSSKNNSAYWINTDLWSFKKVDTPGAIEYRYFLNGKDLYGMSITEEMQLPLEALTAAALTNAKSAAPDAQITKKEYRVVNGKEVIYMEMTGTLSGIQFTYMGYYFSDASGSTQFVTYTATSLVQKYKSDAENFLNGFISR